MKRILLFGLMAVFVGAIVAFMPEGGGDAKMVEGAKALDKRFTEAMNKGDVAGLMACYWKSPDVVVYPPEGMEAKGTEAVEAGWDAMVKTMPGMKFEMVDTHYRVAGDVVIGYGKWQMTVKGPDGKVVDLTGRYTDIKKEVDGAWVYIHDHASVPMMAPEADDSHAGHDH